MKHIVAMGGGGFRAGKLGLDRYVLKLTRKRKPKVCFIPTASGEKAGYIRAFKKAYEGMGAKVSVLTLIHLLPTADLEGFLLENDAIYVGGGNTKSMLALWREWGVDRILKKAYTAGTVLCGTSAGANCWFESCSTDSWPGDLRVLPCLGFLKGGFCPHYDGEEQRRPMLHQFIAKGAMPATYAAEDGVATHFVDGKLKGAITYRADGLAYRVEKKGKIVVETPLTMTRVR